MKGQTVRSGIIAVACASALSFGGGGAATAAVAGPSVDSMKAQAPQQDTMQPLSAFSSVSAMPANESSNQKQSVSQGVFVLDDRTAITRNGETFYPAPPASQSMTVVHPDVARGLGIEQTGVLRASAAHKYHARSVQAGADDVVAVPTASYWTSIIVGWSGTYGPWTKRQGALVGTSRSVRWTPVWANVTNRLLGEGNICGQAVGYEYKYAWGGYGYYERWFYVGCNTGRTSVPWGNVSAYPQLRLTTWTLGAGLARFQ